MIVTVTYWMDMVEVKIEDGGYTGTFCYDQYWNQISAIEIFNPP